MFLSSWVDHKRLQQRPQFNYGHGLLRGIRNAGVHWHLKAWDTLAGDRNLWCAITQEKNFHCNAAGGGYAWLDSEQRDQDTSYLCLCPLPSSFWDFVPPPANPAAPNPSTTELSPLLRRR
jgi:hypothetical protein